MVTYRPDVVLTDDLKKKIEAFAQRYCQLIPTANLVCTSGVRTAASQAVAMYTNYASGLPTPVYKEQILEAQIKSAYSSILDRKLILQSMTNVIEEQIKSGHYISAHLSGRAADWSKISADIATFTRVANELGCYLQIESTCLHTTFPA